MARLAALDAAGVYIEGAGGHHSALLGEGATAVRWLEWMAAEQVNVDVLYVHRSALERLGLPGELVPPRPGSPRRRHPWAALTDRSTLAPSITWQGRELLIGAWQDGAGDPFAGAANGAELLAAALAFRDAFKSAERPRGWELRHSASGTGWRLMHTPWRANPRRIRNLAAAGGLEGGEHVPSLSGSQGGQVETVYGGGWWRLNPHHGDDRPYVHAYDVNGQRLAACSRLRLGLGEPTWLPRGVSPDVILEDAPGYHLLSAVGRPWGELIPPPMEPGWHTTPRVKLALQLGIPLTIEASVVWWASVAYLDPFYEAFRDARATLLAGAAELEDQGHALALAALKQAYLQPLGRLRSRKAAERGDRYYRPSWYDAVIGRELAVEYLRLHQLAEAGVPVLAVYFDAIIIESDEPDIYAAASPLEVSAQLGKWKPVGTLPTPDAHRALGLGGGGTADVGRLMKALKRGHVDG